MSLRSRPDLARCSTTPASSAPQRVAIGTPSSVENPMLVSRLAPLHMAQRLAPDPRWATTTLPAACSGQLRASSPLSIDRKARESHNV